MHEQRMPALFFRTITNRGIYMGCRHTRPNLRFPARGGRLRTNQRQPDECCKRNLGLGHRNYPLTLSSNGVGWSHSLARFPHASFSMPPTPDWVTPLAANVQ
jgi:hypothetical protein